MKVSIWHMFWLAIADYYSLNFFILSIYKFMIIRLFLCLSMASLGSCSIFQQTLTFNYDEKTSMDLFLYQAIAKGLKRDKITTDLAKEVFAVDSYFIGKCNICKNVKKAFSEHTGYSKENKMRGQVVNLRNVKEKGEAGKFAMKEVVKAYLDQHFERSGLSEKQKEAILAELINESDKGLMLANGYSFCPSCRGTKGSCVID